MNTKAVYPRKLQKHSLITHLSSMTDYMAFSFTQSGKFILSVLCRFRTWCNWYLVMRAFEHHPRFKQIEVNKVFTFNICFEICTQILTDLNKMVYFQNIYNLCQTIQNSSAQISNISKQQTPFFFKKKSNCFNFIIK